MTRDDIGGTMSDTTLPASRHAECRERCGAEGIWREEPCSTHCFWLRSEEQEHAACERCPVCYDLGAAWDGKPVPCTACGKKAKSWEEVLRTALGRLREIKQNPNPPREYLEAHALHGDAVIPGWESQRPGCYRRYLTVGEHQVGVWRVQWTEGSWLSQGYGIRVTHLKPGASTALEEWDNSGSKDLSGRTNVWFDDALARANQFITDTLGCDPIKE